MGQVRARRPFQASTREHAGGLSMACWCIVACLIKHAVSQAEQEFSPGTWSASVRGEVERGVSVGATGQTALQQRAREQLRPLHYRITPPRCCLQRPSEGGAVAACQCWANARSLANEGATALSTQVTASEGFAQHDARRCGSLAAVETRWPGRGCSGRRASAELVLVPKQPVCARSSAGGRWRAMAGNGGARPPRCRHGRPAAQKTHGTQSSRDTDMPLPSG